MDYVEKTNNKNEKSKERKKSRNLGYNIKFIMSNSINFIFNLVY